MEHEVDKAVKPTLFSVKTLPFDMLTIGAICILIFVFVPDLEKFTRNESVVTADSMTFSLLTPVGLVFFRLGIGCLSFVSGKNINKIFAIFGALTILSILPHVFRVPLLMEWSHHCGYEVDHADRGYRDTKFVFRQIGRRPVDDFPNE